MTKEELNSSGILAALTQINNINKAEMAILENYLLTNNLEYLDLLLGLSMAKENIYDFDRLLNKHEEECPHEEGNPPQTIH